MSRSPETVNAIQEFARQILHGDPEHRAWLESAAFAFVNQEPLPPVQGGGRTDDVPGYEHLRRITNLAYDQAARGKGTQRHNSVVPKPFDRQPICEIGRMVGTGYNAGQIMKKIQESNTMASQGKFEAAKAEILGAINYSVAMFMLVEEAQARAQAVTQASLDQVQTQIQTELAKTETAIL